MKQKIKIDFADFWKGFRKDDNYFYNILAKHYDVEITSDPEILFYSCYGTEYLRYTCHRVFYTGENVRPDFTGCDYSISFDYPSNDRNFRLPIYALYIDQKNMMFKMFSTLTESQAAAAWRAKKKFCCMVVSNSDAKRRIEFFRKLSKYGQVDSGGRYLNNIGAPVDDKMKFISDYRFVMAFENSSYPGYTTEKILEPLLVDSIPLYWGNRLVSNDFNPQRFINYQDFGSDEAMIDFIMKINEDEAKAIEMLTQPKFLGNVLPEYIREENFVEFIRKILRQKNTVVPVAQTSKQILHKLNLKRKSLGSLKKRVIAKLTNNN